MSVTSLVASGPLLLAMPVAAAAGAVTFLSPCCLPLVPGYLSYLTGMSGAGADGQAAATRAPGRLPPSPLAAGGAAGSRPLTPGPPRRARAPGGRAVAGTALFVLGFSLVFAFYGLALGGLGQLLRAHSTGLTQVLGGITILLGLMFAGVFDRFSFAAGSSARRRGRRPGWPARRCWA